MVCDNECVKEGVWKMVCDKVVCESCVWKKVCERWWLTKLCVKDGVWQSCVVCDRRAAGGRGGRGVSNKVERWCVTKLCVKKGRWKMVVDKVVCESCMWKMVCDKVVLCVTGGRREEEEDEECHECHACHAKPRWMWDCATLAIWNEGGCHQVRRLPRKVPRRHARLNRAQGRHPVPWVPRLPRKTKVDVRLRHACHVKRRWMSPSATRLPRKVPRRHARLNRAKGRHPVPWVPPLLRKTKLHVRLCHACHVKRRWMSPSATRLPRKVPRRHARLNRAQGRHPVPWVPWVPRLPRKTKVDVRLCHACHVKRRWMSPSATPATQSELSVKFM